MVFFTKHYKKFQTSPEFSSVFATAPCVWLGSQLSLGKDRHLLRLQLISKTTESSKKATNSNEHSPFHITVEFFSCPRHLSGHEDRNPTCLWWVFVRRCRWRNLSQSVHRFPQMLHRMIAAVSPSSWLSHIGWNKIFSHATLDLQETSDKCLWYWQTL